MQGDFTRSRYRPARRFSSVRMQQGRVWLDSDWNEQIEIQGHLARTTTSDVVGCCGVPKYGGGFQIMLAPATGDPADLLIASGRIYVGGMLYELADSTLTPAEHLGGDRVQVPNPSVDGWAFAVGQWVEVLADGALLAVARVAGLPTERTLRLDRAIAPPAGSGLRLRRLVSYRTQPDFPLPASGELAAGQSYAIYLDLWQRHVNALEDPEIREVALGGPDTATRTRTIGQVKLLPLEAGDEPPACGQFGRCWSPESARSTARLRARAEPDPTAADPCIVPARAGYRRLENQLYRVEIHTPANGADPPTFKWSRDNGSVVYAVESIDAGLKQIKLSQPARDRYLTLKADDWVELIDDDYTLSGAPAPLLQVAALSEDGDVVTLRAAPSGTTGQDPAKHPFLRRWDHQHADGVMPLQENTWLELEDGVEVQFESGGQYQPGDHWTIPARTALGELAGDVLWPKDGDEPRFEARHGADHAYCVLGLLVAEADGWRVEDCRPIFPPLTELVALHYVGGDGQEGRPGQQLALPLQAGVANGGRPLEGALVRFTIGGAGGALAVAQGLGNLVAGGGADITVATNADGVAGVLWALNTAEASQRVEATLVSPDDGQPHLPVRYGASFRETRGEDPGIHIKDIQVGGRALRNDANVTLDELRRGIRVFFDHEITGASIRRPTFYVTAELPVEFGGPDARDGLRVVPQPALYQPMVLPANLDPAGASAFWVLAPRTADWIEKAILPMLAEVQDRLLLRLTLKGNFIWQETFTSDRPEYLYLDGEAVERRGDKAQPSGLELPSGDGARGGDFELWMWLTPRQVPPEPAINDLRWSIEGIDRMISFDPARVNTAQDATVIGLLHAGLIRIGPRLAALPDLAESFEVAERGLVYTFKLRDGIAFSDGVPITAKEVEFSLMRWRDMPDSWSAPFYLSNIKEIQPIDDRTVRFFLNAPSPVFPLQLGTAVAKIVREDTIENPSVTSGAYLLGRDDGGQLHLVPNDRYWDRATTPILLRLNRDSAEALRQYQAGEIDIMGSLQASVPTPIPAGVGPLASASAPAGVRYIGFNRGWLPVEEARMQAFRRALALGTDRDTLAKSLGLAGAAARIVPPGVPGDDPNITIPFNPNQARVLLRRADINGDVLGPIRLFFAEEGNNAAVVEMLVKMWQENLELPIEPISVGGVREFGELLHKQMLIPQESPIQLYYSFWGADYQDIQNVLSQQLRSQQGNNDGHYSNPEFDKLVDTADRALDPALRPGNYTQAEALALRDVAWLPLFNPPAAALIRPGTQGVVVTVQGPVVQSYGSIRAPDRA